MHPRLSHWRLDGRTALVTGASKGIGYACARELAALGADVLLIARDGDALEEVCDELSEECPDVEVMGMAADLTDAEDRLAVFDWIADLDVELSLLVNNVGGNLVKPTLDYTSDDYRGIFELNVFSAYEMCRLAQPHLVQHANAAIVNVGSVSGIVHVRTGSPYGMTKAALHQLTRNLACEWAEDGIRVNGVAPWYIRTQRSEPALADAEYLDEVLDRTPMGRIGEPEEVAGVVAFLCLPASGYVTGEIVAVDGGFLRYGF
ncbi:SDR family oxidoreductase [Luteibacter sp. PPL201]|uniref:SDR family oxidoreductase n=1 Tax=Luteibacter sahnii TaxID=3021977 RepID=A0ABT6BEY2_9GAMM|nr:SDR family oxidoreductase [Luteibacter sp. PPL193]MDY1549599.1 SDR family oxidoreductase [Luteibacter sp. PPL193]